MDFSKPYLVISPTLEGPILSALSGVDAALTRAQILNLVDDASEAGVRKALARLVEQGIVIEERIGSRYTYAANREHLLWPSVEGILAARSHLRERVRHLTATWQIPPVSIELFGSVAQGKADSSSDVDILIVRPELEEHESDKWEKQVGDLHDKVVLWTGNSCDIVVMDPSELGAAKKRDEPILRSPLSNLAGVGLARLFAPDLSVTTAARDSWRKAATEAAGLTRLNETVQKAISASLAQNQIATLADSVDLGFSKPAARELAKLARADLSWASGLDVIADAIAKREPV